MRGEYIHILCEDLWCASRSWSGTHGVIDAIIPTLDAFERTCGIEFHTSLARDGVYVYHVMDTHKLIAATLRYGWRVTPHTT